MPIKKSKKSRTGLNSTQIDSLNKILGKRGNVIDIQEGQTYRSLDDIARIGEELTQRFTSHFLLGSLPVKFILLDSRISNAYAYWMPDFRAVCITSTMAREIQILCDDVAFNIVKNPENGSGFDYIHNIGYSPEILRPFLRVLLIQGAMAFFIGHEVGHLAAGHYPIMCANAMAENMITAQLLESGVVADAFFAEVRTDDDQTSENKLLFHAHEIDADIQGCMLSACYWTILRNEVISSETLPSDAELIKATCENQDHLLLIASTGAAIALSLMGFHQRKTDWNNQQSHPLTSVRCILAFNAIATFLGDKKAEGQTNLVLHNRCLEALKLIHTRLACIYLDTARSDGNYSDIARQLSESNPEIRIEVMLRVTGIEQAINDEKSLLDYINNLREMFNNAEDKRKAEICVKPNTLAQW